MARISRPPGFDMTYRPKKATFGPPWLSRMPSTLYFGFSCVIGLVVLVSPHLPMESWFYQFFVEADYRRVVTASSFAILLFVSSAAAMLRQQLNGVVVRPDGIETREISFGLPRVKRYAWAQIDRVAVPSARPERPGKITEARAPITKVRLDLWDGSRVWLPPVARLQELAVMVERVAMARAIPVEGGTGLIDDLSSPFGEEESHA